MAPRASWLGEVLGVCMASPPAPWAAPEMPLLGGCRPPRGCPRGQGRLVPVLQPSARVGVGSA